MGRHTSTRRRLLGGWGMGALALLAACQGATPPTAAPAKPAPPPSKSGRVALDAWWGALGGGAQAPAREMVERAFAEQNPDVLLRSTTFAGGWPEMWEKTLAA